MPEPLVSEQEKCDSIDIFKTQIICHSENIDRIQVGEQTQRDSNIFNIQFFCHNEYINSIQVGEHAQRDTSDIFNAQIICHIENIGDQTMPSCDLTQCEYQNNESELIFHSDDKLTTPTSDLTQCEYKNISSKMFFHSDDNPTTPTSHVYQCEDQKDDSEIVFHSDHISTSHPSDIIQCEYQSLNSSTITSHNTNRGDSYAHVIVENASTRQTTQRSKNDKSSKSKYRLQSKNYQSHQASCKKNRGPKFAKIWWKTVFLFCNNIYGVFKN